MKYDDRDDSALVRACLDGHGDAWRALVARYQRLVFAIAVRCGLDESAAADVFQTVFERLSTNLPNLQRPERLQAWVGTTAKREAIRMSRRTRREVVLDPQQAVDMEELPSDDPLPESAVEELQSLNQLRRALERLDTRCRELLTAVFQDEEDQSSYEAIARRLGMPIGSLGPTRARCLEKLRRLMLEK